MTGGREESQRGIKSTHEFPRTDGTGKRSLFQTRSYCSSILPTKASSSGTAGAPQKRETHTALLTILRHKMELQQRMREGEERAGTN